MRPLRLLGKMSYSVYLWHWPLLAFLRYTLSPVLPAPIVVAAMAALIPLSWISYRWIEEPPRAAATPRTRQGIVVAAILATVVVGLGGGVIRRMEGMPFRFSDRVLGVLAAEPFVGNGNAVKISRMAARSSSRRSVVASLNLRSAFCSGATAMGWRSALRLMRWHANWEWPATPR